MTNEKHTPSDLFVRLLDADNHDLLFKHALSLIENLDEEEVMKSLKKALDRAIHDFPLQEND